MSPNENNIPIINAQKIPQEKENCKIVASCHSDNDSELPLLNFEFKGIKITSLLDTGSVVSLLSPDVLELIKQTNTKIKYLSRRVNIVTFENGRIPFKQCAEIKFKIHSHFVKGIFYITEHNFNKSYGMLLGYDFLKDNKIILNLEEASLLLNGQKIAFNASENQEKKEEINNISMNDNKRTVFLIFGESTILDAEHKFI